MYRMQNLILLKTYRPLDPIRRRLSCFLLVMIEFSMEKLFTHLLLSERVRNFCLYIFFSFFFDVAHEMRYNFCYVTRLSLLSIHWVMDVLERCLASASIKIFDKTKRLVKFLFLIIFMPSAKYCLLFVLNVGSLSRYFFFLSLYLKYTTNYTHECFRPIAFLFFYNKKL